MDIKDYSWSIEAGLRACKDNSSSIRNGGKNIPVICEDRDILRTNTRVFNREVSLCRLKVYS